MVLSTYILTKHLPFPNSANVDILASPRNLEATSGLLNHSVNDIVVLHAHIIGGLVLHDWGSVEKEADGGTGNTLLLAVGIHKLLELGYALNLEEDLGTVGIDDLEGDLGDLGLGDFALLLGSFTFHC